jgi:dephospho-CoA kinase
MFVIGLTGGIASGKHTFARLLRPHVTAVIDADEVARRVLRPGTEAYNTIIGRYGKHILDESEDIDRGRLGRIVFGQPEELEFLNALTHPTILSEIDQALAVCANDPKKGGLVLLVAPLLVEADMLDRVDMCVAVTADPDTRLKRLIRDRRMDPEEASARIGSQMSDALRNARADIVIDNNGDLALLRQEAATVIETAKERALRASG